QIPELRQGLEKRSLTFGPTSATIVIVGGDPCWLTFLFWLRWQYASCLIHGRSRQWWHRCCFSARVDHAANFGPRGFCSPHRMWYSPSWCMPILSSHGITT